MISNSVGKPLPARTWIGPKQSETTTISLAKLSVQSGIHTNGAIGLKGQQASVSGFRLNS